VDRVQSWSVWAGAGDDLPIVALPPRQGGVRGHPSRHEETWGSSPGHGGGGHLLRRRWSARLVVLCGGSWDLTQVSGNGDLVRGVMAAGEN
jgi:hypothetical protein